jgi:outer membrane protein assembly factor BamA
MTSAACALAPRSAYAQSANLEGRPVTAIRIVGLRHTKPELVERHLRDRIGAPLREANLATDTRRLDELRLFSSVVIAPVLENGRVILQVTVTETLRILPTVSIRVTDENGFSFGLGAKVINLKGTGTRTGANVRFGGETSIGAATEKTTITPGTWAQRVSVSYTERRNKLYDFDEQATSLEVRFARNLGLGVSTGLAASLLMIADGAADATLSADGRDEIPSAGAFVTLDTLDSSTDTQAGVWAEFEVDRLMGDARSWTAIADGRLFMRLASRHSLGLFGLATVQTGQPGVDLPEYLQFALGGANSVRGWRLGSRRGGNQLLGTAEYAYVLLPKTAFSVRSFNLYAGLQVVGFADIGLTANAASGAVDGSAIDGYGVGLRLLVPYVDVVRLELGWGEPGQGVSAYFGVALKAIRQRQRVR